MKKVTLLVILFVPTMFMISHGQAIAINETIGGDAPSGTEFEDALRARILTKAGLPKNLGEVIGKIACFNEPALGRMPARVTCSAVRGVVYTDSTEISGSIELYLWAEKNSLPFDHLEYLISVVTRTGNRWYAAMADGTLDMNGSGKLTVQ